jgi:glutaredoxin
MFLKLLRNGLGQLVIFIDFITSPKKIKRNEEEQAKINEDTKTLALYQFHACPFCVKTRRNIKRLNLTIDYRDAKNNSEFRNELKTEGGEIKVPCLRIEESGIVKWLYESDDIIEYLNKRFDTVETQS